MADSLETELKTYEAQKQKLLADEGKFVVIHGDEVLGVYATYEDALKIGYQRFKLDPFMVKQVAPAERIQFFTRELDLSCRQSTPT